MVNHITTTISYVNRSSSLTISTLSISCFKLALHCVEFRRKVPGTTNEQRKSEVKKAQITATQQHQFQRLTPRKLTQNQWEVNPPPACVKTFNNQLILNIRIGILFFRNRIDHWNFQWNSRILSLFSVFFSFLIFSLLKPMKQ